MTGDDAVGLRARQFLRFDRRRGGSKDEPVDALDPAVHDRKARAGGNDVDPPRQARHPGACVAAQFAVGMGEPGGGEPVAGAARHIAAAAIAGLRGEALLAIAHHDVDAGGTHQFDGRGGVGPVGDHVAGAQDAVRRNAEARGLIEQGLRRLEIPVRPAEQDGGTVKVQFKMGVAHARSRPRRP